MSPVSVSPEPSRERLLWLGAERASALSDARWARQAAGMQVQVALGASDAVHACRVAPLACVIEYELGNGQNGVQALELLRRKGVLVPVVLICAVPELAVAALQKSALSEAVPVISRAERYERLRDWFEQLQMCLAVGA